MKVNILNNIIDYDGKPYHTGNIAITSSLIEAIKTKSKEDILSQLEKKDEELLTYRDVFNVSLNSVVKDEILSPQEKSKCYEITLKCFANNNPDFTPSQVEYIINRVEKIYFLPLIVGRVKDFLKETEEQNIK